MRAKFEKHVSAVVDVVRSSRWLPSVLPVFPVIFAVIWMLGQVVVGFDFRQEPTVEQLELARVAQGLASREEVDPAGIETSLSLQRFYLWLRGGILAGMLSAVPGLIFSLMRWRDQVPLKTLGALCLAMAVVVVGDDMLENWMRARESFIGEEASFPAYLMKILLIFALLCSPPIWLFYYVRSSIMDRYLIRNVAQPLVFCFVAFLAIWLIIDLSDNGPDFIDAGVPFHKVFVFYLIQLPMIVVQVLPVTVLLALLYSLGKMSRSNEIISMFGSGKSFGEVLRPAFLAGAYLSFVCLALNYHWAPMAEGHKDSMYRAVTKGYEDDTLVEKHFYRNTEENRSWYIGEIPFDLKDDKLRRVWIVEHDEGGQPESTIVAKAARWWPPAGPWRFYSAKRVSYEDGLPIAPEYYDIRDAEGGGDKFEVSLSETPWTIFSSSFHPEHLGVPELRSYIKTNRELSKQQLAPFRTFFHYRLAYPWSCLVVVLIATPLGLVFSRRGLLGGVAACVFVFFGMFFVDNLFLAMGQGSRVPPMLAAWAGNLIFAAIGCLLFWVRIQNRELPKFSNLLRRRAGS